MRILLDTHILLWALSTPERLDAQMRAAILSTDNDVLFSAASIWEIAIKAGLRRGDFIAQPDGVAVTLDAYVPRSGSGASAVVFVHGGGFVGGDKKDFPHDLLDRSAAAIEDRTQLDPGDFDDSHCNFLG